MVRNVKKHKIQVPPPKPLTPQMSSGFVDSMVSGFGWGIGTSLARKVFEPSVQVPSVQVPSATNTIPLTPDEVFKRYQECLERNESTNCENF